MSVVALDAGAGGAAGPWILVCEHCHWSTLDAGLTFEKPVSLFSQLAKMDSTWASRSQPQPSSKDSKASEATAESDLDSRFGLLRVFYASQMSKTSPSNPLLSPQADVNYSSPGNLARIMSLYTGASKLGKKSPHRAHPMQEAADADDGLVEIRPSADADAIKKLQEVGWTGTTSTEQRLEQPHAPRFASDLRPVPTLLRSKRSRRCRACRHILVKPDPRIQTTRYRIKLVALAYVPSMTITPLPSSSGTPPIDRTGLPPSRPLQFLLTLKNPMFDPVSVALAAQPVIPGPSGRRVTILCPQFEIGANADVWDEALDGDGKRADQRPPSQSTGDIAGGRVAEAGKVWARGRNWTTIVLEVVCARIEARDDELDEDEDVLEVPIYVRIEYDAEVGGDEPASAAAGKERERRELAYWTVLGVGKIAR